MARSTDSGEAIRTSSRRSNRHKKKSKVGTESTHSDGSDGSAISGESVVAVNPRGARRRSGRLTKSSTDGRGADESEEDELLSDGSESTTKRQKKNRVIELSDSNYSSGSQNRQGSEVSQDDASSESQGPYRRQRSNPGQNGNNRESSKRKVRDQSKTGRRSKRNEQQASASSEDEAQQNIRRSSRASRHQGTFNFTVQPKQQSVEAEEDELSESDDEPVVQKTRKRGRPKLNRQKSDDYVQPPRRRRPRLNRQDSDDDRPRRRGRPRVNHRDSDDDDYETTHQVGSKSTPANDKERFRDAHEPICAKCYAQFQPDIVTAWLKAEKNRKGKPRAGSLLDRFHTLEEVYQQGCWLECTDCTLSYHFGCLPLDMKKAISTQHKAERKAILEMLEQRAPNGSDDPIIKPSEIPPEKKERQPDLILSIKCPHCSKSHANQCTKCGHGLKTPVLTSFACPPGETKTDSTLSGTTVEGAPAAVSGNNTNVVETTEIPTNSDGPPDPLLFFRCTSCKRVTHYLCLPTYGDDHPTDLDDIAEYWQRDWTCGDCDVLADHKIEHILAWRKPVHNKAETTKQNQSGPPQLIGSLHDSTQSRPDLSKEGVKLPNWKDLNEEAEYLCKFEDYSFSDCSWVSHSFMAAKHPAKLRSFLVKGPLLDLQQISNEEYDGSDESGSDDERAHHLPFNLIPNENAEQLIPKAWLTPEKILDIEFQDAVLIRDIEESDIPKTPEEMYEKMERAFVKWHEQSYAAATFTDKTSRDSPYFPAFMAALERYMKFRKFVVPLVKCERELAKLDAPRAEASFVALKKQPEWIPNQLMDFQLEGLNFCYYNWHRQHPTILADEMGLGKTVQICSLISVLHHQEKRMPFLICVPNSTMGNWIRECSKWIPDLKCVSLPGASDSCEVAQDYDLFQPGVTHSNRQLAAHVVLATYQSAERNAHLLRQIQRWEVVIVDEGQRLKAGPKGGLFRALTGLRAGHKILMSGTPLNNNLRELFHLLSFLNPDEYPESKVDELEERYQELTPELVDELRNTIRPYMLRRTKETVLDLPKLTEIIVPITMRPLQKQVYRGLLSKNAGIITSIYSKNKKKATRAGFQNLLMHLRKALSHPYLYDAQIEPSDVSDKQMHENLVEGSAKLVFLQKFIPKLLARGHRMLMFSQFTIFLDIMERFFAGENIDYLRLDGSTSQLDRQVRIDSFNKPDSQDKIFLLSTRAGGAGINLATADTVIMLDPDYNPHNDLQAISRAHRFGQKKPVTVYKLMTKGSAEEKIMQTGKKKLVLDHLVIQKASEEETEAQDVESILQFGAQEILTESEEAVQRDVRYTDAELDDLIKRTTEEAQPAESSGDKTKKVDKTFAFARVWEGRGQELRPLESAEDDASKSNAAEQRSFWDNILQANQEEQLKNQAQESTGTGRGHRKRKEVDYHLPQDKHDLNPNASKKGRKSRVSDDEDNALDANFEPGPENQEDLDDDIAMSDAEIEFIRSQKAQVMPPLTELQIQQSREAEAQRQAERRKRKLQEKYAMQAVKKGWGLDPQLPSGAATGHTSFNPNAVHLSHPVPGEKNSKKPKISLIKVPNLHGLSVEETRRHTDMILRDLIAKSKALKNPDLDAMINSIRSQNLYEQIKSLESAHAFLKKLLKANAAKKKQERQDRQWLIHQNHLSTHHQSSSSMSPYNSHQIWPKDSAIQRASQSPYTPQQSGYYPSTSYHPIAPSGHPSASHTQVQQSYGLQPVSYSYSVPLSATHSGSSSSSQVVALHRSRSHQPAQVPVSSQTSSGQLPPPRFLGTNPSSIQPLSAQSTSHLNQPFGRSAQPTGSTSSNHGSANAHQIIPK